MQLPQHLAFHQTLQETIRPNTRRIPSKPHSIKGWIGLFFLSHQKEPKNDPQAGGLDTAHIPQGGMCGIYIIHGWDIFDSLKIQEVQCRYCVQLVYIL